MTYNVFGGTLINQSINQYSFLSISLCLSYFISLITVKRLQVTGQLSYALLPATVILFIFISYKIQSQLSAAAMSALCSFSALTLLVGSFDP